MIKEIEVCVKGRIFEFKNDDYSQNELEIMWEMLHERIGSDVVLSLSPGKDILIKATSIDFANKIFKETDAHEG